MSIAEIEFTRQGFQQDIRSDGRSCTDFRPLVLDTGDLKQASGSAHLRLGGTDIIVGVKASHAGSEDFGPATLSSAGEALLLMFNPWLQVELASPSLDRPDCGHITFNVECSPCSGPQFEVRLAGAARSYCAWQTEPV